MHLETEFERQRMKEEAEAQREIALYVSSIELTPC